MFADRLARLDNVVLQGIIDAKRNFTLTYWIDAEDDGLSGCVMGYAAMDMKFYNQGLHMTMRCEDDPAAPVVNLTLNALAELLHPDHRRFDLIELHFGDHKDFDAIATFLGITINAAFYVFHRSEYSNKRGVSPRMVRTRLRQVIRNNGHAPSEIPTTRLWFKAA